MIYLCHLNFQTQPGTLSESRGLFFALPLLKNERKTVGCPGGSVVEHLPSAQVMIPGAWDRVPHRVPHREPASPSAYVSASLWDSLMNKETLKKTRSAWVSHSVEHLTLDFS